MSKRQVRFQSLLGLTRKMRRGPAMVLVAIACLPVTTIRADAPIDLDDVASGVGGLLINGISANDRAGECVAAAGDVNGDGLSDVIVGMPFAARAFVVFGRTDTAPLDLLDVTADATGFSINGRGIGRAVTGIGDLNGDGLADLLVGAALADPDGLADAGECYVVFGKADSFPVFTVELIAGIGGFAVSGVNAGDRIGTAVSSAGDVNGDGFGDFIIGARDADPAGVIDAGRTYVVFGAPDLSGVDLNTIEAGGGGGFVIDGAATLDFSGGSVSGAGDVNGDGLDDVIIGANGAGLLNRGESYVVFGKTTTTAVALTDIIAETGGGFLMFGPGGGDEAGTSVAGVGDINGDGRDDVIVGAPFADPGAMSSAGESFVVFGKTDSTAVPLQDVLDGQGGIAILGFNASSRSGFSVAGAGDVNGDGRPDVIVGEPAPTLLGPGVAYVVYGTPGAATIELSDLALGSEGFEIVGSLENGAGFSVAGAGDVNGDGGSDVLVGAPWPVSGLFGPGEAYVIFGDAPPCVADVDGNGDVGFNDILSIIAAWGPCGTPCPADVSGNGNVDFADILAVTAAWGACPK